MSTLRAKNEILFDKQTGTNGEKEFRGVLRQFLTGPNGSVLPKVWAMGEQSAKHLRGSAMQDLIFGGLLSFQTTEVLIQNVFLKIFMVGLLGLKAWVTTQNLQENY